MEKKNIEQFNEFITLREDPKRFEPYYEIRIQCDMNDSDYFRDFLIFDKEEFLNDKLLLSVISFLNKYEGKFGSYDDHFYGLYLMDNKPIPWLYNYAQNMGLLIYPCHSVSYINIYRIYNNNRIEITLPDIDDFFDTKEELVEYMNNLAKENNIV
jgi:hypothetical protein